jgi:hypothetical protein
VIRPPVEQPANKLKMLHTFVLQLFSISHKITAGKIPLSQEKKQLKRLTDKWFQHWNRCVDHFGPNDLIILESLKKNYLKF